MPIHRGLLWAALIALCVWGGLAWSTPLGRDLPQPVPLDPLSSPVLSPESPLDRELFGTAPGQTKAVGPQGRSRPQGPSGQPPAGASRRTSGGATLPTIEGLVPEPSKPARPGDPSPQSPPDYSRVSEAENPLVDIARRMREAEHLLAQAHSGDKTQAIQESVVRDLDELLKRASARCGAGQACQGQCASSQVAERKGDQPSPQNRPQRMGELPKERTEKRLGATARTSERPTFGRKGPVSDVQRKGLVHGAWGSLPERDRQQMMQLLPPEQFLPKYESLIEEYYRRLGEENGHARP